MLLLFFLGKQHEEETIIIRRIGSCSFIGVMQPIYFPLEREDVHPFEQLPFRIHGLR